MIRAVWDELKGQRATGGMAYPEHLSRSGQAEIASKTTTKLPTQEHTLGTWIEVLYENIPTRVLWFGTRRSVCPAGENRAVGDSKTPHSERSRHIRSRSGPGLRSPTMVVVSEIHLALRTIVGLDLFGDFETEARNGSARADGRTSRLLQPPSLFAIRSELRKPTSSAAVGISISQQADAQQRFRPVRVRRHWPELRDLVVIAGAGSNRTRPKNPSESRWFHHHCSPCLRP
jgi:hypothetical protein